MNKEALVPAAVKVFLAKIGESLKDKRETLRLSREDICRSLKMHINYVIALENGLYEDMPGAASFFAALRSYSRFLGLDADAIISECKNNKFLNEMLLGSGIIERNNSQNQIASFIPQEQSHKPILTRNSASEKEDLADESKPKQNQKTKANLFLNTVVTLLVLGLLGLAYYFFSGQNTVNLKISNQFPFLSPTCSEFTLQSKQETYVRVQAVSVGSWIVDRKVFPGEEITFSDTKGIRIEVDDPNSLIVDYAKKPLSFSQFKRIDGFLVYKCY